MKERPILYSAPMVLAKLAGRKTQTRRTTGLAEFQGCLQVGKFTIGAGQPAFTGFLRDGCLFYAKCPYGAPGDRLWGRETWGIAIDSAGWMHGGATLNYRADGERVPMLPNRFRLPDTVGAMKNPSKPGWRPSIFMPRWASRILDEVVSVRVERLQDISSDDAIAEGLEPRESPIGNHAKMWGWPGGQMWYRDPRAAYLAGWDSINGKGAAALNPWVWRIETKAVTP